MFRHKFVAVTALAVALRRPEPFPPAAAPRRPRRGHARGDRSGGRSPSRPRRSRAVRSNATCASPARCWPTNRPKSAPRLAGRVVETPVERGTRVPAGRGAGADLRRPRPRRSCRKPKRTPARSKRGSGSTAGAAFDSKRVPDVMNAQASLDWAEAEFARIRSLLDQKVVSKSECDQRRTQVEAARQQYQVALNVAEQSYRSLEAARARVALASKSLADTRFARRSPASSPSARQRRRLRHQGRPRRHRRQHRSAARRADRARSSRSR